MGGQILNAFMAGQRDRREAEERQSRETLLQAQLQRMKAEDKIRDTNMEMMLRNFDLQQQLGGREGALQTAQGLQGMPAATGVQATGVTGPGQVGFTPEQELPLPGVQIPGVQVPGMEEGSPGVQIPGFRMQPRSFQELQRLEQEKRMGDLLMKVQEAGLTEGAKAEAKLPFEATMEELRQTGRLNIEKAKRDFQLFLEESRETGRTMRHREGIGSRMSEGERTREHQAEIERLRREHQVEIERLRNLARLEAAKVRAGAGAGAGGDRVKQAAWEKFVLEEGGAEAMPRQPTTTAPAPVEAPRKVHIQAGEGQMLTEENPLSWRYLRAAGGNPEEAVRMAQEDGWVVAP
jgi:hypothetical protein